MKKLLMFTVMLLTLFIVIPKTNAASIKELQEWTGGNEKGKIIITKEEGKVYEAKLTKDLTQPNSNDQGYDLKVAKDESLTLDLAGHKFLSYSGIAIEVENGGTLIINDSEGKGSIVLSQASIDNHNMPILNSGTLTINGGTIIASTENATGILNNGTLTVNDGAVIKTTGTNVFGITNHGTTNIQGGTFEQGAVYSIIMNSGKMTIEDGVFNTSGNGKHNSLITNQDLTDHDSELIINGGNYQSNLVIFNDPQENAVIYNGIFQNPDNVAKYLAENLIFDESGNIIKKPANVTVNENKKEEKNPNTSDYIYTCISIIAVSIIGLSYIIKKKIFN